jgi:hypothetical protein
MIGGGLPGLRAAWDTAVNPSYFRSFGAKVTKYVSATCAEVDCSQYATGWAVEFERGGEDQGVIEKACDGRADGRTRRWSDIEPLPGNRVRITFPAGQPCFKASSHRIPWAGRFYHRDGDWRANPSGLLVNHRDASSWVSEFGEHQQKLADRQARG